MIEELYLRDWMNWLRYRGIRFSSPLDTTIIVWLHSHNVYRRGHKLYFFFTISWFLLLHKHDKIMRWNLFATSKMILNCVGSNFLQTVYSHYCSITHLPVIKFLINCSQIVELNKMNKSGKDRLTNICLIRQTPHFAQWNDFRVLIFLCFFQSLNQTHFPFILDATNLYL